MSDSVQPQRQQPTRLPRPWDSPGKNAGVGCHFLLQCMKVKSESEVAQSCLTPNNPMDCSPPGSSAHGIFQARELEWGAIAFSVCIASSAILWITIMVTVFPMVASPAAYIPWNGPKALVPQYLGYNPVSWCHTEPSFTASIQFVEEGMEE